MMKNLMQVFTWLMVVAICLICFIGANLVIMEGFISDLIHGIFFPRLIQRSILQIFALGGIAACLTLSYFYFANKSANKGRVRVVYAGIGLLVALAFVFSEYQHQQEKLIIRDVCTQFDLAVAGRDYETAYEFMSPNYRQTHSLAQLITGAGSRLTCGYPFNRPTFSKSVRVVLLHPRARNASVIHTPFGSLNTEILLEQVDGKWYLTGETRHFPA
jgi:hypothetical protein